MAASDYAALQPPPGGHCLYSKLALRVKGFLLHDLKYETSFESLLGEEGDRCCHVACIDADHVRVFVVAKVCHLL
jgi:hypothetical protein